MKKNKLRPESLMMSYGYKPELSEGSLKCPIFQTSTFVFKSAQEGKEFFELAYGLREAKKGEKMGLIYSRINNPDLEILEDRLTLWDGAEACAVFKSGMAAISTVFFEFLKPGDLLLHSCPTYGGTDHFINHVLPDFGIHTVFFKATDEKEEIIQKVKDSGLADRLTLVYTETPANPTNDLIDLAMCKEIADHFSTAEKPVYFAIDNTYLGPVFQHPIKFGADLVLYSATKYIGGHSDVVAGACLGSKALINRVKVMRTFFGGFAGPWASWLLMRSLETLKPRMELQTKNAKKVAKVLKAHPKVEKVYFLGFLKKKDGKQYEIYKKQCLSSGAMLSFDIKGGEKEAFRFLDNLQMIKLAVSLGSTESLAEHPCTMTHVDMSSESKRSYGISPKLIRLSIGIEHHKDLIADILQALNTV